MNNKADADIEEIKKASNNISKGIDIESSAKILEAVILNNCIISGGRINILKLAVRQILEFIKQSKKINVGDKNILDYVKENVKLKNKLNKSNEIIDEMAEHIVSSAIVDDTVCAIKFCGVEEDCTHEKMLKCTKKFFEKKSGGIK